MTYGIIRPQWLNTLRQRQNGRHFADAIFKCIFLNENVWTPLEISLKFVPEVWINNMPTLVQIMAWHRPGDKPLSEWMMVSLLTHIWVTRPQWMNGHQLPTSHCLNQSWPSLLTPVCLCVTGQQKKKEICQNWWKLYLSVSDAKAVRALMLPYCNVDVSQHRFRPFSEPTRA